MISKYGMIGSPEIKFYVLCFMIRTVYSHNNIFYNNNIIIIIIFYY